MIYKSASDFERVKASKLRRKPTLTKLQRQWLTAYEARVEAAKASRKSERVANTNVSFAQSTAPPEQFSGDSMWWAPVVPEPSPGEAPPPPGVEPPKPGDPIVDTAAPAPADPQAAQQAAMVMAMIVRAGILAAMELLADVPLPEQYRAVLSAPASHNEVIVACSSAAYRLAIKYNVSAVPLSDEITCGVAIVASAGAWLAVHKKKKKAAEDHASVERAKDANPEDPRTDPSKIDDDGRPAAKPPIAGIW